MEITIPLISILTAAYAPAAAFLGEAADSVQSQRLPDGWELEWIVQEDGHSPALGNHLTEIRHVHYEANDAQLGPAATRNLALARVSGSLVQMLDHDDVLLPDAVATLIPIFLSTPIHWAIGQADDLHPDGSRTTYESALPFGPIAPGAVNTWAAAHGGNWPIHCAGLMMRTASIRALGGWAASPSDDDLALFAALSQITPGHNHPSLTWLYRQHPEQTHRTPAWRAHSFQGRQIALQRATAVRDSRLALDIITPLDPTRSEPVNITVGPPAKEQRIAG
jgi:glycosyltransferase involved in cell wall biosynthesis